MKTSIKIILLVLFALLAIGAVLMFMKTRVAPPVDVKNEDQYEADIKAKIDSFASIDDFEKSKPLYADISDRLYRFNTEKYLDDENYDKYTQAIDTIYGRNLANFSYNILRKPVWPEENLNASITLIDILINKLLRSGEPTLNTDLKNDLNNFKNLVTRYHEALAFSKRTGFVSVPDAAARLEQAQVYKNDEFLCNNAALVEALNNMPKLLADSHYNHVAGIVNNLANYKSCSQEYYRNHYVASYNEAVRVYNSTNIYGGNKKSLSSLINKADQLTDAAVDYYYETPAVSYPSEGK